MKKRKGKLKKSIINSILVCITFVIMIWLIGEEYTDASIPKEEVSKTNMESLYNGLEQNNSEQIEIIEEKVISYPKVEVQKEYKGYEVLAKLEIPSISLQSYILKENSKKALDKSVTKFWGSNPNQVGNFCVAGHNAPNKNMFRNLKKLTIGDRLFISDNTVGKVEYEVYDMYKVFPEDVSCLSQQTEGRKEVTLITCTNDSKQRTIVKARELE